MGGIAKDLFGSKTTQESGFRLDPRQAGQLQQALQGLIGQTGQLGQQAEQTAGQFNTSFGQFRPSANLDPRAQRVAAQGQQAIQQQAAAQQQQIANRFRNAPGVSSILRQQNQTQSALQQNPLLLQAAQDQTQREAQQFQFNQAAQQAGNQALGQQFALQSQPLAQQQALLQAIAQAGALTGTSFQQGRTGGLF